MLPWGVTPRRACVAAIGRDYFGAYRPVFIILAVLPLTVRPARPPWQATALPSLPAADSCLGEVRQESHFTALPSWALRESALCKQMACLNLFFLRAPHDGKKAAAAARPASIYAAARP